MVRVDDPENTGHLDTEENQLNTSRVDIGVFESKPSGLASSRGPADFKDPDENSSVNRASFKQQQGSSRNGNHPLDVNLDHSVAENPSSNESQVNPSPRNGGDISRRNSKQPRYTLFGLETPRNRNLVQAPLETLRKMLTEESIKEQSEAKEACEDEIEGLPADLVLRTPKAFVQDNQVPYWQDPREYSYQSWNHFSQHHTIKAKRPAFLRKKEVQEQDFIPVEVESKKVLDTLPIKLIVREICLDYKYDPEHCFNSVPDVISVKSTKLKTQEQDGAYTVPTIKMEYRARAWLKPRDSLYQPGEFPEYKAGKHVHKNREHGEAASRSRMLKASIARQTEFIQKKSFFPLLDKQNAEQLILAENQKLAEINRSLTKIEEGEKEKSVHNKKQLGKMNYVSDRFIDDFVELDSRHLYDAEIPVDEVLTHTSDSDLEPEEFHQGMLAKENAQTVVDTLNWSGEQVFSHKVYRKGRTNKVISSLNNQDLLIWLQGCKGFRTLLRKWMHAFIFSVAMEKFLMLCVLTNTLILTLDGFTSDDTQAVLTVFNTTFTLIFVVELCIKLWVLGLKEYVMSTMNLFDAVIVILSIIELTINSMASESGSSGSALSAFRVLRVFRMFRVLRVTRLLRSMKFMKVIVAVIVETAEQYAYIAVILLLFIFIYTLLGMQIYAGNLLYKKLLPRTNFDSIEAGAWTLFQLLTFENWTDILEVLYNSSVNHSITIVFVLSWLVIGNYIFFNLFLALLLGGFDSDNVVKQLEEEVDEFKELQQIIQDQITADQTKYREFQSTLNRQSKQLEYILNSEQTKGVEDDEQFYEVLPHKVRKTRGTYFVSRNTLHDESSLDDLLYPAIESKIKPKPSFKFCDRRRKIYQDVHCETSLYFFRKDNPLRIFAASLVSHQWFEPTVIGMILISSLKLVAETYLDDLESQEHVSAFYITDVVINCCFIAEMVFKVLRNGLFLDKNSYLKDPWAMLDAVVVAASVFDMSSSNSSNLPVMKILRTLRPLRFVQHYKHMKIIVNSLVGVLGPLLNVGVVVLLVWVIFSILGMNFVGSKLGYCDTDDPYGINRDTCIQNGGTWKNAYWNFDNIFESLTTLYVLTSLEGWPSLAASSLDASDGDGMAPTYNDNVTMKIYFLLFIMISAFFLLDLFTGVIFYQYGVELDREVYADCHNCSDEQIKWIMMQKMILFAEPNFNPVHVPKRKFRRLCYNIVTNWIFELGMLVIILLNIVVLALEHEWMSVTYETSLNTINTVLVFIYLGEFVLKFTAYMFTYFKDGWNSFDFVVVLISLVDFVINQASQGSSTLSWASKLGKGFRVVRIVRVIKLFKSKEISIQQTDQNLVLLSPNYLECFGSAGDDILHLCCIGLLHLQRCQSDERLQERDLGLPEFPSEFFHPLQMLHRRGLASSNVQLWRLSRSLCSFTGVLHHLHPVDDIHHDELDAVGGGADLRELLLRPGECPHEIHRTMRGVQHPLERFHHQVTRREYPGTRTHQVLCTSSVGWYLTS